MHSLRRNYVHNDWSARRTGVVAIRELLLMLVVPLSLWMISQAVTGVEDNSKAAVRVQVRPVYNVSVEPDELHMWVYRLREDLVRINLMSGAVEQSLSIPGVQLTVVAYSRDHSSALLCGADGTVVLFRNGQEAKAHSLSPDAGVNAAVSDDGAVAIVATESGQFCGWREQGGEIQDFALNLASNSVVLRIGLNSTGRRLFFAKNGGVVSFRNLESPDHDETTLNAGVECVAFTWSRDERHFGVVTADSQIRIYDVSTGRVLHQRQLDDNSQQFTDGCIATISPDGRRIAVSAPKSCEIYLWDFEAAQPIRHLKGHGQIVHTMQFSPDSERLYSGSYDGTIREWSLTTYSQLRVID
ncbi:MAG: repeat-containing protein [Schlesneria sp.]|nr:repeat-containing protein [Schlesneria sp.]